MSLGRRTFVYRRVVLAALVVSFLFHLPANADQLHVAAASNFRPALEELVQDFENQFNHEVVLSYGSSGKLFAQISHGAPYDVFLSADQQLPQKLALDKLAIATSRFTYARGKLKLWIPARSESTSLAAALAGLDDHKLAIANPRVAPYGKAAQQVLEQLNLWSEYQSQIVRGENIAQALHFVDSGNAVMGFIAASQASAQTVFNQGLLISVNPDLHDPIEQDAVIIKDTDAARSFMKYLKSADAIAIINRHGYSTP